MISNKWDKIRSAIAKGRHQRVEDEPSELDIGGIAAELFNAMAAKSAINKQIVLEIAAWTKQEMKDDLRSRNVSFNPRAKKEELFQAVIHAFISETRPRRSY